LLSVDLHNAEYYFQANPSAKSEQIGQYFADMSSHYEQMGFKKMIVFLDRNTRHKTKMQSLLAELSKDRSIKTEFHLMAAYSP
jgi:hypothetical protein